jgi:hypothetical protein
MTNDSPARRRRTYVFPGRQKRLSIRVTDGEEAEIADAANRLGLTPTGFCAHAALDAARNLHTSAAEPMEHEALGNLQAELFQARVALNQFRAELERTRIETSVTADNLDETITHASRTLTVLDGAISRIHRRLGEGAPHRPVSQEMVTTRLHDVDTSGTIARQHDERRS